MVGYNNRQLLVEFEDDDIGSTNTCSIHDRGFVVMQFFLITI